MQTVFLSSPTLIVDTSALVALLLREVGWEAIESLIQDTPVVEVSSATYVEFFVVLIRRYGRQYSPKAAEWLESLGISVVPFDEDQAMLAREAFQRFGKGRHPAGLNFGDCFSYALAKHRNEPLLFKGEDFRQTDVLVVPTLSEG